MFGPIFTFNLFICPFILICLHVLQGRECLGLFLPLICLLVVLSLMCLHVLQGLECLDLFLSFFAYMSSKDLRVWVYFYFYFVYMYGED